MRITDVEKLKKWIMDYIRPICEADPEALAKYVIALLKKDQMTSDLKNTCNDQLEAFLKTKTPEFVTELFDVISSESYINQKSSETHSERTPDSVTVKDDIENSEQIKTPQTVTDDKSNHSTSDNDSLDHESDRISSRRSESKHESERYRRSSPHSRYDRYSHRDQRYRGSDSRGENRSSGNAHRHEFPHPYTNRQGGRKYGNYRGSRPRCRDFYEKGVCINGNSCPFNHGQDAMVLMNNNQAASFSSLAAAMAVASTIPNLAGSNRISNMMANPLNFLASHANLSSASIQPNSTTRSGNIQESKEGDSVPSDEPQPEMYNPENPDISSAGSSNFSHPDSVPTLNTSHEMTVEPNLNSSCTLQIHRIPPLFMNYASFNSFFGSFGKIVDIQLKFNGNAQSALITFSTHQEANRAFTSPHAIFGNRFVRMSWFRQGVGSTHDQNYINRRILRSNSSTNGSNVHESDQNEAKLKEDEQSKNMIYIDPQLEKKLQEEKERIISIKQEAEEKSKHLIEKYDSEARKIMKLLKSQNLNEEKRASLTSILNNILQQKDRLLFPKKYSEAASALNKTKALIRQQMSKKIDNRQKSVKFSWASDPTTESSVKQIVSDIIQRCKAINKKDFVEQESVDSGAVIDQISHAENSGIVRGNDFNFFIATFPSHYLAKSACDEAKDILGLSSRLWQDKSPGSEFLASVTSSTINESSNESISHSKTFYDGGLSPDINVTEKPFSNDYLLDDDDRSWKR